MSDPKAKPQPAPRREALKKMGKLAAYSAPAIVTLLASRKAVAAS